MTTPKVHEFPVAGTTRPASLRRYPPDVLARMAQSLRERACPRSDELASLGLIERELADRRRRGCQ